nr:hypothetical protein Iba_chr10dCG11070 [Ipomoea batatas]
MFLATSSPFLALFHRKPPPESSPPPLPPLLTPSFSLLRWSFLVSEHISLEPFFASHGRVIENAKDDSQGDIGRGPGCEGGAQAH